MRATKRVLACVGAVLATGVASVVIGAPMVSSGPFSLPNAGVPPKDIWTGPTPPRRTATRVRVKTGKTEVQTRADLQEPTPFLPVGIVEAGDAALFESAALQWRLALPKDGSGADTGFPAEGLYEVFDVEDVRPQRGIGSAWATFAAQGSKQVYFAADSKPRLFVITSGAAPMMARGVPTGNWQLGLDANDAAFAAVGSTVPAGPNGVALTASAACVARLDVLDAQPATSIEDGGAFVCVSHSTYTPTAGNDTDYAYVDGSTNLRITFVNHCAGTLWVWSGVGAPWQPTPVGPNQCATITGRFTSLAWVHTAAGRATVTVSIVD